MKRVGKEIEEVHSGISRRDVGIVKLMVMGRADVMGGKEEEPKG